MYSANCIIQNINCNTLFTFSDVYKLQHGAILPYYKRTLMRNVCSCNMVSISSVLLITSAVMFSYLLVCKFVCLSVRLFVWWQQYGKTHGQIFMIFLGYVGQDRRKKSGKFEGGAGMFNPLHTRFLFIFLQGNHFLWATIRKNGRTDFHEVVRKVWTWDKEQFVFSGCCG